MEKLEFLDTYWKNAKEIAFDIKHDLPNIPSEDRKVKKIGKYLSVINYSDLGNTWSVHTINNGGLIALGDKISTMILKGDACNVKPMVESICDNRIKNLRQPNHSDSEWRTDDGGNEKMVNLGNIGKGHFRWDFQAYTLTDIELNRVKEYFNIS